MTVAGVLLNSSLVRLLKARQQNLVCEEPLEFKRCPVWVMQWSVPAGAGTVSSGAGRCCFQSATCLDFGWKEKVEEVSGWGERK